MRVDYKDGFGLMRASNTTPVLVLRFEGHTPEALHRIEADCMAALRAVKPDAQVARPRIEQPPRHAREPRAAMRVLIVKLSSLGDVVHAMPVVHDIRAAHPGCARSTGWSSRRSRRCCARVRGVHEVIELPAAALERSGWWRRRRAREGAPSRERLRRERYDAVLDLQGLTKSALVRARWRAGCSYGLANRTEGASHEWPARWLADARDPDRAAHPRARPLARTGRARARHRARRPRRRSAWRARRARRSAAMPRQQRDGRFVHGTSRDDKLWPEASWIELGASR